MVRLQGVGKTYDTDAGPVQACAGIDLEIRESEFVAIVGPSGCGKTTIMKMVAGLQPYTTGSITVGGRRECNATAGPGTIAAWEDFLGDG